MNKQAKIIIIALLCVNITLLITLYLGQPRSKHMEGPKELIIERLGFEDVQITDFEGAVVQHFSEIQKIREEIRTYKQKINADLLLPEPKINDTLNNLLSNSFKKMEELHFRHLTEIKEICNEEQKKIFDEMVPELGRIFDPRPRGKKRRN